MSISFKSTGILFVALILVAFTGSALQADDYTLPEELDQFITAVHEAEDPVGPCFHE